MSLDVSQNASAQQYWADAFQPRVKFYNALVEQTRGTSVSKDTLELVENELQALQAQSAQFYKCINALRPVSRLSPELLSIVFHYLSIMEPAIPTAPEVLEDRNTRHVLAPTKTWVKVTHVCSTFRQYALGDRSLWCATTTAFGPQWMNLFVERCRAPPRAIHIGFGAPMLDQMRSLLQAAHAVQISSLHANDDLLSANFVLPEVRSLRIHVADKLDDGLRITKGKPKHNMPHLTDLHIHGLLDFDTTISYITDSLTSLYIGSDVELVRHTANDVLDMLARLPRLESLTLTECDLYADDDTRSRSISVPALKHLCIGAETFADVVVLFDALELSPGISAHLAGIAPYVADEMNCWSSLEHALSKPVWADLHTLELMGLPEDPPEMVRQVESEDQGSVVVSAWRDDEPAYVCVAGQPAADRCVQLRLGTTQDLRPKPDFSFQLTNYIGGRSQDSALGKAITLFKVAPDVRTLSMRPGLMEIKLPWLEIFTQYPRLTAIRVDREDDFGHLLETLYFVQVPLPVRELSTISFPFHDELPWLWSEHVNWTNPTNKKQKKRGERGALLGTVLLQRGAAGAPLSNIYVEPSQLQSQHLWNALAKGGKGRPDFMQDARRVFKPIQLWNWEDWGRGL